MTLLLMAAAIAFAFAVEPTPTEGKAAVDENSAEAIDPSAAAIVADCNARKFETSVEIEKDGQKRLTKLKLCAVKDADEASWVRTIEDAKAKIAGHSDISEESKAKIAAEFDAEIGKIQAGNAAVASVPVVPAPLPSTPVVASKPTATTLSPARMPAKPRLTIRCLDLGETGGGSPCSFLERDTRLAIHADEDLAGTASLRFLRRGDARGEIALAGMRLGQSRLIRLPGQLCIGVSSSKVEIQLLSSGQVIETLGPYKLRC